MNRYLFGNMTMLLVAMLMTTVTGWAGSLPEDADSTWSKQNEIFVPMRDGIHLATDVWLPKGAKGKMPTVLLRTPYGMNGETFWIEKFADAYLERGYALVFQDERGRHFSEGEFTNYLQGASTDGYDTVEWITKQPWSNGKVGAMGCSSSAETQWPMAASNPPGLAAIIPVSYGTAVGDVPGNATRGAIYRGGVPVIGLWSAWYEDEAPSERLLLPPDSTQEQRMRLRNSYSLAPKQVITDPQSGIGDAAKLMHLPSKDVMRNTGGALTAFDNYVTWTPADPRWKAVEQIGAGAKPRVPALHIDHWHDGLGVGETTRLFKYLQDIGTPNQYLIIAAGPHCSMPILSYELRSDLKLADLQADAKEQPDLKVADLAANMVDFSDLKFGDLEVGDARYQGIDHGYAKLMRNWFAFWLKGDENAVLNMPKVQLFVQGKGWISDDRWPLQNTHFTNYYLETDQDPRHPSGTGILSPHLLGRDNQDSYVYDPGSPTPSRGGSCCHLAVALDQRPVEQRKDVLVYSTAPLQTPVTIAGPIEVVLYVSSSAKDTDFMVKLVDVYPDGKAINLSDDAFRARYREGFDKKVLMTPGNVYKITLSDMVTAMKFSQGHRIRLDVASSDFPLYERNLNTGGNNYDETSWVAAENSIHHGKRFPSHVVLPVLPE